MAYFPNGTSHEMYHEDFCLRCVNWRDTGDGRGEGCPIMDLHSIWNYDAVGDKADQTKLFALETFIPRKGLENEECKMFIPKESA